MLAHTVDYLKLAMDDLLRAISWTRRRDVPFLAFFFDPLGPGLDCAVPSPLVERMMAFLSGAEIAAWSSSSTRMRSVSGSSLLLFQLHFCSQTLRRLGGLLVAARDLHAQARARECGSVHFLTRALNVYFLNPTTHELGRYRWWHQYDGGLTSSRGWLHSPGVLQLRVEEAIAVVGSAWYDPSWVHRTIEQRLG